VRNVIRLVILLAFICTLCAQSPHRMVSKYSARDVSLNPDPATPFWEIAPAVKITRDSLGNPMPDEHTEVRSRWTKTNLYLLYVCHFQELSLKSDPSKTAETNYLWNWDVAEAFIGSDYQHIRRYKEFEMSPQGEWVDLDIDLDNPHHEDGWKWNSGFRVATTIDRGDKVWYGVMRIPYSAIDTSEAASGNTLRINLYRIEGSNPRRLLLSWQPTHQANFHVPESFGELTLGD
jgi:Carbohydrate family 9 binding domain-like